MKAMRLRRTLVRSAILSALALILGSTSTSRAGGGPENLFLVVNSASWASQTVANHFIQLRKIPPSNVFYIDWSGGFEGLDAETFREKILAPSLDAFERRGLKNQIDYLVYSSDFPYSIDLTEDFAGRVKFPQQATPACSLNSATYLWNLVYAKLPNIMELQINRYMRSIVSRETTIPTHGFRSWYGWGEGGELQEAGGQPYLLSTVLAVTSGRGNSVREAIAYLQRSAAADGTRPAGTVYFCKTADVRSKARASGFEVAVEELKTLGVKATVIATALPMNRPDVAGAMTGAAEYSWASSKSKILPGAICENFTSFGGIMAEGSTQTPLSEFLRYGAAGSSGTIVEPMALPEKFPWPLLHVHYARGCSLAEAYYQSVFAPAQLLIVGDPLCQPWASVPAVQAEGVKPGSTVSGMITLTPTAKVPNQGNIDRFQLFVDGRRVASVAPGESLKWDSNTDADGYHELRVVAVGPSPIETTGRVILPITVGNSSQRMELTTVPSGHVRWDETLTVRAKAPGMKQVFVVQNGRPLGVIAGEEGELAVNPRTLGLGPISIQALAVGAPGTRERVVSAPTDLTVDPPKAMPPLKDAPKKLGAGLAFKLPSGKVVTVQDTRDVAWPALAGLEQNQPFVGQAFFDVANEDVYQFQVWHYGQFKLSVDGVSLYDGQQGNFKQKFLPVALAPGRHRLSFSGRAGSEVRLRILFGGPGALSLNGKTFRHQTQ